MKARRRITTVRLNSLSVASKHARKRGLFQLLETSYSLKEQEQKNEPIRELAPACTYVVCSFIAWRHIRSREKERQNKMERKRTEKKWQQVVSYLVSCSEPGVWRMAHDPPPRKNVKLGHSIYTNPKQLSSHEHQF